jgi:hypothetical protein
MARSHAAKEIALLNLKVIVDRKREFDISLLLKKEDPLGGSCAIRKFEEQESESSQSLLCLEPRILCEAC